MSISALNTSIIKPVKVVSEADPKLKLRSLANEWAVTKETLEPGAKLLPEAEELQKTLNKTPEGKEIAEKYDFSRAVISTRKTDEGQEFTVTEIPPKDNKMATLVMMPVKIFDDTEGKDVGGRYDKDSNTIIMRNITGKEIYKNLLSEEVKHYGVFNKKADAKETDYYITAILIHEYEHYKKITEENDRSEYFSYLKEGQFLKKMGIIPDNVEVNKELILERILSTYGSYAYREALSSLKDIDDTFDRRSWLAGGVNFDKLVKRGLERAYSFLCNDKTLTPEVTKDFKDWIREYEDYINFGENSNLWISYSP